LSTNEPRDKYGYPYIKPCIVCGATESGVFIDDICESCTDAGRTVEKQKPLKRWALVRLNEVGFACEIRDSEKRAAALLAVARADTAEERWRALDALRECWPDWDKERE